jgi:hypothetical protein
MSSLQDAQRNWTDADKERLVSELENGGFDGDFLNLAKKLYRSPESLRYLVERLLSARPVIEWEVELNSKIDQLYGVYQSILSENVPLVLTFASLFGHFPDPSEVGGIEYFKCYSYLASLMCEHVPQGVGMVTTKKLLGVFFRFREEVISGSKHYIISCVLEKKTGSKFEGKQYLSERRSQNWTGEETRARSIIESGELQAIKIFHDSHATLNPFFLRMPVC